MKRKITNYMMINILSNLEAFAEKKLPQKITYAILKNIISATEERKIYNSQFDRIVKKYSEHLLKDENDNIIINEIGVPLVDETVKKEYLKEIEDLLDLNIEMDVYLIDEKEFNYVDGDKYDVLSASEIYRLQSILCVSNNDKSKASI